MKKFILICGQFLLLSVAVSYAQSNQGVVTNLHVGSMQKSSLQHISVSKKLQKTQPDRPIMVTADNPIVKVTLTSNPTTGYSWFLVSLDGQFIQPVSAVYAPPANKKLMGAPGTVTWTFKVNPVAFKAPCITTIKLIYARPWDLSSADYKVLRIVT